MARATKSNGFGRENGFLSDIVSGEVAVETPNGFCSTNGNEATCTSMQQGASGDIRGYGARSGTGKTLTVK